MFSKVLIANRGEIAVRIARTCRELGVSSVAIHSDVDAGARHVALADEAVALPGVASNETYLNISAVIDAARVTGAEAVHPGYGFLAENAEFAQQVIDAGLSWIGPPPEVVRTVGDKIRARALADSAGVPVVPGISQAITDASSVRTFGETFGYPIAVKAAGGGGGKGLKVVYSAGEVEAALSSARREAEAYFGDSTVYLERYLDAPKHLEVQILAPNPDEAMWLGVRDCSFQRRHQKLLEETPPARYAEMSADMGAAAVAISKACGYVGAGTVEFLVDRSGQFYFLEVNARLQVEHTVTEEVLGIDLVACQLAVASGDRLGFSQDDLEPRGHAIECRVNAEDPRRGFLPTPGTLTRYVEPNGFGVRVDSGYGAGDAIPEAYDSLLAKVITWGNDREEARSRMLRALTEMEIEGVSTTIPAHLILLEEPSFREGVHTSRTIEDTALLDQLIEPPSAGPANGEENVLLVRGQTVLLWNRAMAASAAAAVHGTTSGGEIVAPMQGTILKVLVSSGQAVGAGDPLMILEAMKMETTISAPHAGNIVEVRAQTGETVGANQVLAVLE